MAKVRIDAAGGGDFSAYFAAPPGDDLAPAIIVILEIRGINTNIRAICDDWAARGYLAVAPDLLWRTEPDLDYDPDTPQGWEKAMKINAAFDENKAISDLTTTLRWVRRQQRSNGVVGAVGYCLGGKLAYLMATRSDIDAAVGYYGIGIDKALDEAGAIAKPLMLHIAGADHFVPPDAQQRISRGLAKIPGAQTHIYTGAGHAFARTDGIRYDAEAARLADQRTASFIERNLGG